MEADMVERRERVNGWRLEVEACVGDGLIGGENVVGDRYPAQPPLISRNN